MHLVLALAALLLATPALAAEPAGSSEGWRGARFGMTPAQVVAVFGGEAVQLSPEVKLADGNTVSVGIDGHVFEGFTVDVRFVFSAGKLVLVSLRNPEKKPVDDKAYLKLRDALVKRWGAPLEDTRDDNFIDMRQTRWNRGADRADLKYIPGVVALVIYPRPAPGGR